MPSLKTIRKRIGSVKSTQKITRAMKMVAAARLRRAQQRITELRPFALKTAEVLRSVAGRIDDGEKVHPLLARREERQVLLVVIGSDRGLAGGFNANVTRAAERMMRELHDTGKHVRLVTIGRKPRDYFRRRGAEIALELPGVNEKVQIGRADEIAAELLDLYLGTKKKGPPQEGALEAAEQTPHEQLEGEGVTDQLDAVYLIYNEFKSAMTQRVAIDRVLPVATEGDEPADAADGAGTQLDFLYEPSRKALLDRLLPLYVQISVYRSLLESVASFFGAQMTAMEAATGNAKDMIARLTLVYNRARQAAITKELMEIIGGAEALK
ncbi:MAG: ATP synthase F1 subunit gamma [Polyangiales bacterium]